ARSQTSTESIARTDSGYRLDLPAEGVDALSLAAALTDSEQALASGANDRALDSALWAAALGEDDRSRRIIAVAHYRQVRNGEALPELDVLTLDHPLDEELAAEHLRALAQVEGPSAALHRFDELRSLTIESFGTSPGHIL